MCHTVDNQRTEVSHWKETTADSAGTEEYEQVYKYRPAAQIVAHFCGKGKEVDIM
jgi:hypothetical protein